jgi:RNA polymerase sigma-70 factor (ECF subfamily)
VRAFFFRAAPLDGPDAVQVADMSAGADVQTESRQELARAEAAIAALPDGLKEAFLLFAVEGLSQKEAAEALGISAKAVELRVFRARKQIKAAMGSED